jgi:hypothetical protein
MEKALNAQQIFHIPLNLKDLLNPASLERDSSFIITNPRVDGDLKI